MPAKDRFDLQRRTALIEETGVVVAGAEGRGMTRLLCDQEAAAFSDPRLAPPGSRLSDVRTSSAEWYARAT